MQSISKSRSRSQVLTSFQNYRLIYSTDSLTYSHGRPRVITNSLLPKENSWFLLPQPLSLQLSQLFFTRIAYSSHAIPSSNSPCEFQTSVSSLNTRSSFLPQHICTISSLARMQFLYLCNAGFLFLFSLQLNIIFSDKPSLEHKL